MFCQTFAGFSVNICVRDSNLNLLGSPVRQNIAWKSILYSFVTLHILPLLGYCEQVNGDSAAGGQRNHLDIFFVLRTEGPFLLR